MFHSFIHSFIHSFLPSFLHSLLPSFLPSFFRSFVCSFVRWFVHSLVRFPAFPQLLSIFAVQKTTSVGSILGVVSWNHFRRHVLVFFLRSICKIPLGNSSQQYLEEICSMLSPGENGTFLGDIYPEICGSKFFARTMLGSLWTRRSAKY